MTVVSASGSFGELLFLWVWGALSHLMFLSTCSACDWIWVIKIVFSPVLHDH